MVGPSDLVFGVLIPAVIAGIVLFFGRGTGSERPARFFLGALALGLAYLVADVGLIRFPRLPSADVEITTHEWIAWFVLGAIVLAPMRDVAQLGRWANPFYVALFCVLMFRFPFATQLADGSLAFRVGLTFVMYVAWNASDQLAERLRGPALPAAWVVAGTGIALCALDSRIGSLAQLAGAVTAGLGAAAVVGLIDKGARFSAGAVAIVWIVFAGVITTSGVYGLSPFAIALLVIALLAPWCAASRNLKGRPLAQTLYALVAAGVPAGSAVFMAWRARAGAPE